MTAMNPMTIEERDKAIKELKDLYETIHESNLPFNTKGPTDLSKSSWCLTLEQFHAWSTKDLKEACKHRGVSIAGLMEKEDLRKALIHANIVILVDENSESAEMVRNEEPIRKI